MAKQTLADMIADAPDSEGHGPDDTAQPVDAIEQTAPRTVYQTGKTYDSSEVITPRMVLAQQLSPEVKAKNADSGQWLLMGHQPHDEVSIVIAGHATKRRYVIEGQDRAACYSPDNVQGYGNPGIKCDDCPLSKWHPTGKTLPNGKPENAPPKCSEIDEFLAYSVTHGMPVFFPLKGTGAKAARFIKTLCNGLGEGNFAVKLSAKEVAGKGNRSWFEPVVVIDDEVSQDEANAYALIARRSANTTQAQLPAEATS